MPITHLKIGSVRNLSCVDIEPCVGLNLFFGENGSGKTSLLEAISVLAHGKSFRTVNFRQVISHHEAQLSVFGVSQQCNTATRIGVLRPQRGVSVFKVDGSPVYSSTSLATLLPLQVMNSKSYELLEGPPKVRRRMFDWLVFHVKHEFGFLWRDYTKALKHRNSLLRRDKMPRDELMPWNIELNRLALSIDQLRRECLGLFKDRVNSLIPDINLPAHFKIDIEYQRGWSEEHPTLASALEAALDRDRRYGFTTCGAHKSEIQVLVNSLPVSDVLSRGQQKSLVAAFLIAELKVFQDIIGRPSVLLIDDLPAELDQTHIKCLASWLQTLDTQMFVTGINALDMEVLRQQLITKPCKLFHVKHGEINECKP
jgi:DNA replication and repair protein RecF